ncbi:MAG: lipooligosaccharide transport system permease protein [Actinomycetota bacterium]|jgi:lipooligosaccharide transport system permease protein
MLTTGSVRVFERQLRVYKTLWRGSVLSHFAMPLMFLGAMGVGLGPIVDARTRSVGGVDYLTFIAPGLLAFMIAQSAAAEALWPVMAGHKWLGFYHGTAATPIEATEVFSGYMLWLAAYGSLIAALFVAAAALLGGVSSLWAPLAIPAAVLGALCFACPFAGFAMNRENDFAFSALLRLVVMPTAMFSGTFFPVSQLPAWLRSVVLLSPLYHSIELCRAAMTGHARSFAALVAHVSFLVALIGVTSLWARVAFRRRLAL